MGVIPFLMKHTMLSLYATQTHASKCVTVVSLDHGWFLHDKLLN